MADFDALIKQALKTQNSADSLVREKVYQSSRNALMRMLEKAGSQDTDAGKSHFAALENSISRIEAEFTPKIVEPAPPEPTQPKSVGPEFVQPAPSLLAGQNDVGSTFQNNPAIPQSGVLGNANAGLDKPTPAPYLQKEAPQVSAALNPTPQVEAPNVQPVKVQQEPVFSRSEFVPEAAPEFVQVQATDQQADVHHVEPNFQQEVGYHQDDFAAADPEPILNYKRKSPILRRLSTLLIILIVLGVIFWLVFAFIANLSKSTNVAEQQKIQEQQQNDKSSIYLNILTPNDPSALVTSGRGSAEVVTELNRQYLRIKSIRNTPNSTSSADPILLELQPGVLQKIAGKAVTVEIRTKSGSAEDGLFSIQCLVAGESVCDRKRFPVGQQPENVIFALKLANEAANGDTFLAINTDVKSAVNSNGEGNPIDILYVRIRMAK